MKATLQIEIKSDEQLDKIRKVERLLDEAGIIFDKGTDLERNIREWEFDKIKGAKLHVEEDSKLSLFMRIHALKHKMENAKITDPEALMEAREEIDRLEKELEHL